MTHPPVGGRPGSPTPQPRPLPRVHRAHPHAEAALRTALRRGEVTRLRPGVFADAIDRWMPEWERAEHEHLLQLAAGLAALRAPSWASHTSAALLHGCWVLRLGRRAEVTQLAPPDVRDRRDPLMRHWTQLPERDRTELGGVPITTIERTVVDCALTLPGEQAAGIVESGLRMGADRDVVEQVLRESRGKRGVRSARRVLSLADGRVESLGEARLRWIAFDDGLPPLAAAVPVETHLGTRWVDLGWPDMCLGLEFDGELKYAGDDAQRVILEEKARHDALVEAGWTVLRVTWRDLATKDHLLYRLHHAHSHTSRRPPRYRPSGEIPVLGRLGVCKASGVSLGVVGQRRPAVSRPSKVMSNAFSAPFQRW
ncbi:hypothetical protein, partial [Xylanimonas ulmi]